MSNRQSPISTEQVADVDRRDIRTTYERAIRIVAALAGVGGQGKEIWANLTGGNNAPLREGDD